MCRYVKSLLNDLFHGRLRSPAHGYRKPDYLHEEGEIDPIDKELTAGAASKYELHLRPAPISQSWRPEWYFASKPIMNISRALAL